MGVVLRSVLLGVLVFALGAILFAVRGYLNTDDKAVAGALIFVAVVANRHRGHCLLLGTIASVPLCPYHSGQPLLYTFCLIRASTVARSSRFHVASPIHALVSPR